jgi:hypothetical protein
MNEKNYQAQWKRTKMHCNNPSDEETRRLNYALAKKNAKENPPKKTTKGRQKDKKKDKEDKKRRQKDEPKRQKDDPKRIKGDKKKTTRSRTNCSLNQRCIETKNRKLLNAVNNEKKKSSR